MLPSLQFKFQRNQLYIFKGGCFCLSFLFPTQYFKGDRTNCWQQYFELFTTGQLDPLLKSLNQNLKRIFRNKIMYCHTSLQYRLIQFQSNISSKLGILPFIWNSHSKKYLNSEKAFIFFILTTICLCPLQYMIVVWNILYHIFRFKTLPITGELYYSCIWLIIFALQQVVLSLFYFKCNEFVTMLNTIKFHCNHVAGTLTF